MDKNLHFKLYTEQPRKLVGVIIKLNGKLKNHYIFKVHKSTAGYHLNI